MIKRTLLLFLLLLAGSVLAQDENESDVILYRDAPPAADIFTFETIASNLSRPLQVTHAGDGSGRLFIVQQGGRIYVRQADNPALDIFIDIRDRISPGSGGPLYSERGLLGLAFHPQYAENGYFFVYYTDGNGDTVISRYQVSDDPNIADRRSEQIIFTTEQPFGNHNGGHMAFGADGYLYVALGDGGSAGDPQENGENLQTLLGSILRLDVSVEPEAGYTIPADNPFVDTSGQPEIWSYGWRNPWRFSFDRATGDMYIGDVGQNQWEEINFEPADSEGGLNYGWDLWEASYAFEAPDGATQDSVLPVAEYDHSQGCSVTGGYVYRGDVMPDLHGVYLYSDFCSGRIWYAYRSDADTWVSDQLMTTDYRVSSFGEDEAGEVYIVDYTGRVLKLVPNS